jgi:hypothetical protein
MLPIPVALFMCLYGSMVDMTFLLVERTSNNNHDEYVYEEVLENVVIIYLEKLLWISTLLTTTSNPCRGGFYTEMRVPAFRSHLPCCNSFLGELTRTIMAAVPMAAAANRSNAKMFA